MKKIFALLIIISILLNTKSGNAQWLQQNSGTYAPLYSVYCVNADTVYIAGGATILKTIDGGAYWNLQNAGTTKILTSIHFEDANTGYAVGDSGTILKTTNGGANWNFQNSGTYSYLKSVFFVNKDTGFICGKDSTILKTTNGGNIWNALSTGTSDDYNSIYFVNDDTGYAVGGIPYTETSIIKTINGGVNWTSQNVMATSSINSVFCTNADTVYCGGNSGIIRTLNGGNLWISYGVSFPLFSIYFPNNNIGFTVGWDPMPDWGYIFKTTDGGINWNIIKDGTGLYYNSICFANDSVGYVVGMGGLIEKTTNGGIVVGMVNIHENNIISINPNPFNIFTKLTISPEILTNNKQLCFEMYDLLGNKVYTIENINTNVIDINRKNLKNGIYLYKIFNNDCILKTEKIVIQ